MTVHDRGLALPPRMVLAAGIILAVVPATAAFAEGLRGAIVVAGHGPEHPVIDSLARAFERAHPGTVVNVRWNRNVDAARRVQVGQADLAVTGRDDPGLSATTVAWDGIAVVVNFSNPVKEVTAGQLRDLFSGKTLSWFDLNERASASVEVLRRPDNQNITAGFEKSLGITGGISKSALNLRDEQQVLSRVSGRLGAVGYLSLGSALEAVKFGTPVRVLIVNGVEPGEPTVKNGRYKLRRPVVLLAKAGPNRLRDAFVAFTLSPEGQRIIGRQYFRVSR